MTDLEQRCKVVIFVHLKLIISTNTLQFCDTILPAALLLQEGDGTENAWLRVQQFTVIAYQINKGSDVLVVTWNDV